VWERETEREKERESRHNGCTIHVTAGGIAIHASKWIRTIEDGEDS